MSLSSDERVASNQGQNKLPPVKESQAGEKHQVEQAVKEEAQHYGEDVIKSSKKR